jgi:hypothetical protein
MAAEVQTGKAVVHGITNSGTPIAFPGYATFILSGVKGSHKWKLNEIKDEIEFDTNLTATNPYIETTITWMPSGATRAAAATTAVFLTPLASIALANFKVGAFNGTWIYVGDEEIDLNSTGPAAMSIKIRKYDDATQNTSLSTTVSG